jgi:O-antigen/teichoic acid export membrane protein
LTDPSGTTSLSVFRGGVWHATSRIVPQFYVLATSIVAARFLGPTGMGRQSFIAFVELSLAALLSNGFYFALARIVGERIGRGRPGELRSLIRWAWRVEGVLALLGGGMLVLAALLGAGPRNAWLLAGIVCVVSTVHAVPTAVLIGAQRWRQASLVGLVTGFAATVATIIVLSAGGGITGMFAVEAAIGCANLVWTTVFALQAERDVMPGRDDFAELRDVAIRAIALLSFSELLALLVQRRSEVFFLAHYSPTSEIALYSIVYSVVTAVVQVPNAMAAAVSPAVATLFGAGAVDRIRSGYERGLRLLIVASLPLAAGGIAIGPTLLRVTYGDAYRGTAPILVIMMAIFPIMPLGGLASALLTGLGRFRLLLAASAFAAVTDVGLAALLVPRYDAIGAALANMGAQIALTATLLASIAWLAGFPHLELNSVVRAFAAALATGIAAYAGVALLPPAPGVVVGFVLGATVFLILTPLLRILSAGDAAWLDRTLGRHVGGRAGRFFRASAATDRAAIGGPGR